ncbi:hypothetical protein AAFC00_004105 [Neodothiora populina]|uniref:Exosome complex protein n=1 Tax=Neodothiora populina TaxID=2781224 RepID=A0ABR3PIK9_9PEZI
MDVTDLAPQLSSLSSTIDSLQETLSPLLTSALSASTSKLPLLDKAKLYVWTTYAIESLLFSYLRLNGVDAKTHPVFQELVRTKHYFEKITAAEDASSSKAAGKPRLDTGAAGRFIKAGLAGNEEHDRQRRDMKERERGAAKRKFEDMGERVGSHIRFEDTAEKIRAEDDNANADDENANDDDDDDDGAKGDGADEGTQSTLVADASSEMTPKKTKAKGKKRHTADDGEATIAHKKKKSNKAPRGAKEAFLALSQGASSSNTLDGTKSKTKNKSRA